jgi:charged multivesicular body protein 1
LFNLKFTAKSLERQSKKCQKEETQEKQKLKKAIQQGNNDGARIYAQNAIRKKNEALNLLKLASRIDAVASRVNTAVSMKKVTSSMSQVVKGMDSAMQSMNLEKISGVMDKFEQQFEDLDVQTSYMDGAISNTTTMTTPQQDVESLMQQVALEHGLELNMEMGNAPELITQQTGAVENDQLTERLSKLRNAQ